MKNFIESIIYLLESFGKARAAAELTRQGRYDEARKIFQDDNEVHP